MIYKFHSFFCIRRISYSDAVHLMKMICGVTDLLTFATAMQLGGAAVYMPLGMTIYTW